MNAPSVWKQTLHWDCVPQTPFKTTHICGALMFTSNRQHQSTRTYKKGNWILHVFIFRHKKQKPFFFMVKRSFIFDTIFLRSFLHVVQDYVLWHNKVFDDRSRRLTKQKACSDGNTRYVFVLWKIPLLSLLCCPPAVTIHLFGSL